jgi:hypothetical protein
MTRTFRAVLSAYLMLGGSTSVPALIWVYSLACGVKFDPEFAVAVSIMPLSFVAWLAAFRLCISEETISYRSLFGGVRSAKVSEIKWIRMGHAAGDSGAPLGIELRLHDGTGFTINAKPFSREAIAMLLGMHKSRKP